MATRETFEEGFANIPLKTVGQLIILTWFLSDMIVN